MVEPSHSQRWEEGEARWVPRHHLVNTRVLECAQITESRAKSFVKRHHYSGSYPAARMRYGLFQRGNLVGVAVLSVPSNQRVIPCYTPYQPEQGVELGRLVLLDEVAYNAESFFLGQIRRALRRDAPRLRTILAYSDPVVRVLRDGTKVFAGHYGQIYQATNASYQGRGTARKLYLDARGRVISARSLSKIRGQERGHEYARALLEEATDTVQHISESSADWIKRALKRCQSIHHPGNHVYVWGMDKRASIPKSKPFPKHIDPVQLGLLAA